VFFSFYPGDMKVVAFLLLFSIVLTSVFWRLYLAEQVAEGRTEQSETSAMRGASKPAVLQTIRHGQGVVEAKDGVPTGRGVLIDSDGKRYVVPNSRKAAPDKAARKSNFAGRLMKDPKKAKQVAIAATAVILLGGAGAVLAARRRLVGR
jgi:hypothetical protein